MRSTHQSASANPLSNKVNRILYGAFVLLSLYFGLTGSYEDSAVNLGIALIVDPFDQTVRWDNRPRWQRGWLIVHLLIMVGIGVVYWRTFGA
ncbi:hypothetical protein EXU85_13190 [Spirosoma sp. KCTC 42546]|uniref:hypothetical protein n=1 Tax=Spirosoma sp. KCTC 42546 TaxID=2520506 RepID=UPI0011587E68|nr:hypothetical protein [Spirosoma sp. KCTC 42546]QDK79506.1 hypothetical protein EXU85_13190 [Spirosoma sp. KCTC 42546]